jgi:hypothetical protein
MVKKADSISQVLAKRFIRNKKNRCAWCAEPVIGFRDKKSEKEYSISGLCQKCQDEVFRDGES